MQGRRLESRWEIGSAGRWLAKVGVRQNHFSGESDGEAGTNRGVGGIVWEQEELAQRVGYHSGIGRAIERASCHASISRREAG